MAKFAHSTHVLLLIWFLLSLSNIGTARYVPRSNDLTLRIRQTDSSDSTSDGDCFAYCEISTCGGSTCPLLRRESDLLTFADGHIPARNRSNDLESPHSEKRRFVKRAFIDDKRWTQNKLKVYLPRQIGKLPENPRDPQYGNLRGFQGSNANGVDDMRTVSDDDTFGNNPFTFGTGSLHGCTMLTVASKRAVWMAHFWEKHTTNINDDSDFDLWQQSVINPFAGGPQDPRLPQVGSPINPALFNQPGDRTVAYIMAPTEWGVKTGRKNDESVLRYPRKIRLLREAIKNTVGQGIHIELYAYPALNWNNQKERDIVDQTERGIALFQYDPNSDKNGQKAYRLFYEHQYYTQDVG